MPFAMVAGEASGDLLGATLMDGLLARWPRTTAHGIGGPRMIERGFEAWWPAETLALHGYAEALVRYRELVGIRARLRERLIASPPRAFIGIDAPDFNLDLEGALKARGIRTVHYVCPSIWAWRADRVHKIKASCDRVLCLFPFEPPLLEKHGIAATYVGHPLANAIPLDPDKSAARAALGLPGDAEVVAILPGSRGSEVKHLAERFFRAALQLAQLRSGVHFVVPAVPSMKARIEAAARAAGLQRHLTIVTGQSHTVLAACDVALVASGTATLEAALFKRPMVIAYSVHWFSWVLMRPRKLQPWVGLPNILAGDFVVPELLQQDAKPERLVRALLDWLAAPDRMAAVQEEFRALHLQLRRDTAKLATDAIEETIRQD
ncbi:MAG TPA: lipid-A-disaccharide synthase [Ramlibacter sp.]|uniref:lipid-A-disaccharide synthase n=1 Tax=Ramlibacter sp. TaxID=1917967 RepID=UPI002CBF44D7|nr:lipid-A-disaccharide synthase [Ramlibacter sp.]HVZ43077.1 lipid-A-disaccharide synthase [Ramlibacter sp.]